MADAQERPAALEAGDDFRLVLISAPDAECGERLARGLVGERLAACVSQIPGVVSTYRWQGAVEQSAEVLLLVKTTGAKFEALAAWIREHHPYDVPEIVGLRPAELDAAYGAWLAESC